MRPPIGRNPWCLWRPPNEGIRHELIQTCVLTRGRQVREVEKLRRELEEARKRVTEVIGEESMLREEDGGQGEGQAGEGQQDAEQEAADVTTLEGEHAEDAAAAFGKAEAEQDDEVEEQDERQDLQKQNPQVSRRQLLSAWWVRAGAEMCCAGAHANRRTRLLVLLLLPLVQAEATPRRDLGIRVLRYWTLMQMTMLISLATARVSQLQHRQEEMELQPGMKQEYRGPPRPRSSLQNAVGWFVRRRDGYYIPPDGEGESEAGETDGRPAGSGISAAMALKKPENRGKARAEQYQNMGLKQRKNKAATSIQRCFRVFQMQRKFYILTNKRKREQLAMLGGDPFSVEQFGPDSLARRKPIEVAKYIKEHKIENFIVEQVNP